MKLRNAFSTFTAVKSNEPNLINYFVHTNSIKKIKESKNICIVSGLKGIGKTATFRELTEFDRNSDIIIDISPDMYSLNLPSVDLRSVIYSNEFEFELAIELLQKFITRSELHIRIDPKLVKEAKSHVKTFIDDLKSLGGRIKGISVLGCGFDLSDPKTKILTGLKGRNNEFAALETLKKIANAGITMRIVIDDPEEVFLSSTTVIPEILGGLWLACARLNLLSEKLHCYILMKTHIFDLTRTNTADLDKYPNSYINICWEAEDLKNLIQNRIIDFTKCTISEWENQLFGKIHQREKEKIYNYLFSNLRNGPRELITWIYYAFEYLETTKEEHLNLESLKNTVSNLSSNSFNYFNSSNGEEFKEIGSLIKIIFENNSEKEFTKAEFTDRIRDLLFNNDDFQKLQKKHTWIQSTVSYSFAEIFFRVGALNIIDTNEIYPFMCKYNLDSFNKAKKIKLTPLFKYYLQ
jgi:hypothetical protein